MREFEHKRKVRRVLSSPLVLVPLAIILFFLIRGTWNIYLKDRASVAELRLSQERLTKLQDREASLMTETKKLSTESGVESEIRDRFQMAKTGEQEVVIVDSPPGDTEKPPVPQNFLQKILNFFTIR